MNEDESQRDQNWVDQLEIIANFIKETIDFLENYCAAVAKKTPSYRHPLNMYLKAWRLFSEKLHSSIQGFKDKRSEVLLSTILNWVLPTLATTYNDLFIYIKTSVSEAKGRP